MNRKNLFRTLTVIAAVLLLGWVFFYFNDDTRGFKPVDTSVAVAQISSDNVKLAQIDDREQQLRLELKNGNAETGNATKVIAKYPTGYAVPLFDSLTAKGIKSNTAVNQPSVLGSLLVYMLPLILLIGLFMLFSRSPYKSIITYIIDSQKPLHILYHPVHIILGADSVFAGTFFNFLSMLIRPGEEICIPAVKPVESGYYISYYKLVDLSQVQLGIHIWNRSCNIEPVL